MPVVKRSSLGDHPCSIARTLDVAGEWWTPLILRDVAYGVRRFAAIQADLGISANVLADRLDTLVAEEILRRSVYRQRPERHEYSLTEKGADLIPALLALMQWGDRWAWADSRGPVRVVHEQCDHDVRVEVRCSHCERELATRELRAKLRGGVVDAPGEREPGGVSGRRLLSSPRGVSLDAERDASEVLPQRSPS
jgi:DNA-binding HxlR family transcriptional regulator